MGIEWIANDVNMSILWYTSEFLNAAIADASNPFAITKQLMNSHWLLGAQLMK